MKIMPKRSDRMNPVEASELIQQAFGYDRKFESAQDTKERDQYIAQIKQLVEKLEKAS